MTKKQESQLLRLVRSSWAKIFVWLSPDIQTQSEIEELKLSYKVWSSFDTLNFRQWPEVPEMDQTEKERIEELANKIFPAQ